MTDSKTAATNRRRNRRLEPKRTTKAAVYTNAMGLGRNIFVAVLDVSESGIRLVVKEALKPDQEIALDLEGLGHRRAFKVGARVIWSVPTADSNFCVGLEFQRTLPYADVALLAKF
jgi:hypothetical protein